MIINFIIKQRNYIKQHFLQGVMFNSSSVLILILRSTIINVFIKIPFSNKGMELIDLNSIFKLNLVSSSVPNYFDNY